MDHTINNYRVRKFGDKYFLTTDHGSFCILTKDEMKKLKRHSLDDELVKKLEEKEIILNESNLFEAIRLTRNRNSYLLCGTSLHIIVITLRCNMKCIYCHASSKESDSKKYDMDKSTAKKTVGFIFQTPSKSFR